MTKKANIEPKNIPHIKKKFTHDPDFPIRFLGTSFRAKEKQAEVFKPFVKAKSAICITIIIPKRFP